MTRYNVQLSIYLDLQAASKPMFSTGDAREELWLLPHSADANQSFCQDSDFSIDSFLVMQFIFIY